MLLGGPMASSRLQNYIPGPGNYYGSTFRKDSHTPSLKSRIPDHSRDYLLKVESHRLRIQAPELIFIKSWARKTITLIHGITTKLILEFPQPQKILAVLATKPSK